MEKTNKKRMRLLIISGITTSLVISTFTLIFVFFIYNGWNWMAEHLNGFKINLLHALIIVVLIYIGSFMMYFKREKIKYLWMTCAGVAMVSIALYFII